MQTLAQKKACKKLCQECQRANQQTSLPINGVASKFNEAAVERMLYFLLFVLSALATCLLIQHLLKAVPQMDWSCHTKNICVHTHTLQNAHHFFHVNLYHGIKHDCGKTCVYNSNVYNICIYIYNFKYTIYLIFFSLRNKYAKNTSMVKNNFFFPWWENVKSTSNKKYS